MKQQKPAWNWRLLSLVLLAAVLVSACSGGATPTLAPTTPPLPTEPPPPTTAPVDYSNEPFVGMTWYWVGSSLGDGSQVAVADPTRYTIQFNLDGNFFGKADCNQFAGSYMVEGPALALSMGPMTMAACPPDSQADEYLRQLGEVMSYTLVDGSMDLALQSGGVMSFSQQPAAPVTAAPAAAEGNPLVGRWWQWQRLDMSDGSVTAVPDPSVYTIQFNADGSLIGQADCNTFRGSYTTQDASLKIEPGATTMMACPEGSLADQYLSRLSEVATYVIQDGFLYMNLTMDSGNLVFAGAPLAELPAPAAGAPSVQANVTANLRSGPGAGYPAYAVMPFGTLAGALGKDPTGAWYAVDAPTQPLGQGWVSAELVAPSGVENLPVLPVPPLPPTVELAPPAAADPQTTTLESLYLFSGPSTDFPAYGVVRNGAVGQVLGRSTDGEWWVVRVNPGLVSTGFGWLTYSFNVVKNIPQDLTIVETPPLPPSVAFPAPPAGAASGVAMTALNVRSGAGATAPLLGVAPAGSVAEITGISGDNAWWRVLVPNTISPDSQGWVDANFFFAQNATNVPQVGEPVAPTNTPMPVAVYPTWTPGGPTSPPYGTVTIGTTTEPVNLRAGPGNQYDSYGRIPAGTSGVIVDQNSDGTWYAFKVSTSVAKDGKGWISALYVKVKTVNAATATAMATPFYPVDATKTPGSGATSQPPVTKACKIIEKKPVDGTVYKPNFEFDMKAVLENTSDETWEVNAVDVKFISALNSVPIHTTVDLFDLQEQVKPDNKTTVYVDMKAPAQEGTYGETWALVQGGTTLCQWSFTITVKKP